MKRLPEIIEKIEKTLDQRDLAREEALKSCRALVRLSGHIVRELHRGGDVGSLLKDAQQEAGRLRSLLQDQPALLHSGAVTDGFQEFCEAVLTVQILRGEELSGPQDLGVPEEPYLLGLGDVVGELRRVTLRHLQGGEVEEAGRFLAIMEEIYDHLLRFDHPSAIISVRRKQDVARGLIEKTRGEVAVASRGKHLERRLDELQGKL